MGQLVALIWCSWVVGFERKDGEDKRGEKKKMNKKIKVEKRKKNNKIRVKISI
jgi:membrane protein implicated in regulation of membrane protease activity